MPLKHVTCSSRMCRIDQHVIDILVAPAEVSGADEFLVNRAVVDFRCFQNVGYAGPRVNLVEVFRVSHRRPMRGCSQAIRFCC